MIRIRLKRLGRKKRPFYRVVITNLQTRRDGAPLAEAGFYDPIRKQLKLNLELIQSWIAKGAQPSETVARLLKLTTESNVVVDLGKKDRKEHLGEASQAKPVVEEVEAEVVAEEATEDAPEADSAEADAPAVEA
jgi:small subunit ribosomal protein S16